MVIVFSYCLTVDLVLFTMVRFAGIFFTGNGQESLVKSPATSIIYLSVCVYWDWCTAAPSRMVCYLLNITALLVITPTGDDNIIDMLNYECNH